jgi:hypothetical protein
VRTPSEAETRPRVRIALERGAVSPEGRPTLERGEVSVVRRRAPRARQSFARGVPGPTA